tara:strand:- start:877 stop:2082 length:1206 start_codon:yes stop_codon:yes gene_type:complete
MIPLHENWKARERCLILMAAAAPFSFSIWMTLLNNFTVEMAHFGGREIGILQSVREIPGFLAFTAVFILLLMREQILALMALALMGVGVAITGHFPSEYGLYSTTLLMSIGFHYFETVQMSLSLQWLPKHEAPKSMGRQLSAKSIASVAAYIAVYSGLVFLHMDYATLYMIGGTTTLLIVAYIYFAIPRIEGHTAQHKAIVLRKRYWLYYALTFMGGARRQIFVVFAGFLLVQKFGFAVENITLLFLANYLITTWFAPKLGGWITRFGERQILIIEYVGLIIVFSGYAITEDIYVAAGLYIIDHVFFSFAIAQKSYLQKIADPADIAATSSVSFSINHIAAVFIPVVFGTYLWNISPSLVFWAGTAMAGVSLMLSLNVPRLPTPGNEVLLGFKGAASAPAK